MASGEMARGLYRRLLRASRQMSLGEERAASVHRVRSGFRAGQMVEAGSDDAKTMMKVAQDRLAFLCMQLPLRAKKKVFPEDAAAVARFGERLKFDAAHGSVISSEPTASGAQNARFRNTHSVDPDSLATHNRLLRRMRYEEAPPPSVYDAIRQDLESGAA